MMQNYIITPYDISLDPYYYHGGYAHYLQPTQYYNSFQEPTYVQASMGPIAVPNEIPFPDDFLECHNLPLEQQPQHNDKPVYENSRENVSHQPNVQPECQPEIHETEEPTKKQRYLIRKEATLPYTLVVGLSLYNINKPVPVITLYKFIEEHFPGIAVDEVNWQKSIRCHLCSSSYFRRLVKSKGETKSNWTFKSNEAMEEFFEALRKWMENESDVRYYGVKSGADWDDLLAGRKSLTEPEPMARREFTSPGSQYKITESRFLHRLSRKRIGMPYLLPADKFSTSNSSTETMKPKNDYNQMDSSKCLSFYRGTTSPWISQPNFFW